MGSLANGSLSAPQVGADPRTLAQLIRELKGGKINAVGAITLATSSATTVVSDPNAGASSVIPLMPTTANAAAALATTYVSAQGDGTFTLTHANNAQNDRTFCYAVLG